jgi:hypothetical protein
MAQDSAPRRSSVVGPVILISIGVLFLIGELRPSFHPWMVLWTYWPLFLILMGVGLMYDSWQRRQHPDAPRGASWGLGAGILIFFIVLFALAARGERYGRWRGSSSYPMQHLSHSVDKQNAKSVNATIEMPAGELNLSGGSSHLLEADFDYRSSAGAPKVDYSVSGTTGELRISQEEPEHIHTNFRTTGDNHWTLHFANDIPLDVHIEMGAGRGNLRLQDIDVMRLKLELGAGQVDLDLTGDRKQDLTADLEGGVGEAQIRLPKNIGVIVNASGGIGTIDAPGMHHDGDQYTNDAYGKTPVTIHLRVEGGVGRIGLRVQP